LHRQQLLQFFIHNDTFPWLLLVVEMLDAIFTLPIRYCQCRKNSARSRTGWLTHGSTPQAIEGAAGVRLARLDSPSASGRIRTVHQMWIDRGLHRQRMANVPEKIALSLQEFSAQRRLRFRSSMSAHPKARCCIVMLGRCSVYLSFTLRARSVHLRDNSSYSTFDGWPPRVRMHSSRRIAFRARFNSNFVKPRQSRT
jgi:hypothetical protein